jgi:hypothetical protein
MPFTAINSFDFFDKLRIITEGYCYPPSVILTNCDYPIVDNSIEGNICTDYFIIKPALSRDFLQVGIVQEIDYYGGVNPPRVKKLKSRIP